MIQIYQRRIDHKMHSKEYLINITEQVSKNKMSKCLLVVYLHILSQFNCMSIIKHYSQLSGSTITLIYMLSRKRFLFIFFYLFNLYTLIHNENIYKICENESLNKEAISYYYDSFINEVNGQKNTTVTLLLFFKL